MGACVLSIVWRQEFVRLWEVENVLFLSQNQSGACDLSEVVRILESVMGGSTVAVHYLI